MTSRLIATLVLLASPLSADWPQWGGPNRDFTAPSSAAPVIWGTHGPDEIWRRPLGDGYSGLAIAEGQLFTLHRDRGRDVIVALDAANGTTVWTHAWDAPQADFMDLEFGPGPHSTPLIAGDTVFAVGSTGRLVALSRKNGRHRWSRELWADLGGTPLERGYAASPIAFGDLVILPVGGPGRALIAFDQRTGEIVWSRHDYGAAYTSPILVTIDGQTHLVALLDTAVVGVEPATGAMTWSLALSNRRYVNVASPFFSQDDLLTLVSSDGAGVLRLHSVDGAIEPEQLWVDKSIGSQVGNIARFGGHLYGTRGASASKYLTAVNASTGEIAWRDRTIGDCILLRVRNQALILGSDGQLHLADLRPTGLDILASKQVLDGRSWTAPTLAGSRLYLRGRKEVVALELAPRQNAALGGASE